MENERIQAAIKVAETLCVERYNTRDLPEDLAGPIAKARAADTADEVRVAGEALGAALAARGTQYRWTDALTAAIAQIAAAAAEAAEAPVAAEPEIDESDLPSLTVAELRQVASNHTITIPVGSNKAEIISLLTDALAPDAEEDLDEGEPGPGEGINGLGPISV